MFILTHTYHITYKQHLPYVVTRGYTHSDHTHNTHQHCTDRKSHTSQVKTYIDSCLPTLHTPQTQTHTQNVYHISLKKFPHNSHRKRTCMCTQKSHKKPHKSHTKVTLIVLSYARVHSLRKHAHTQHACHISLKKITYNIHSHWPHIHTLPHCRQTHTHALNKVQNVLRMVATTTVYSRVSQCISRAILHSFNSTLHTSTDFT